MEKTVLILSDFVSLGSVALTTARTVLTRMGLNAVCLPTAVFSNTFNLGRPAALDTTMFLKEAVSRLEGQGVCPDGVLLGYLSGTEQAEWAAEQCARWQARGTAVILDPIFADNGKLYGGISESHVRILRDMLPYADWVLPNVTEAGFLADRPGASAQETARLLPARNTVITGADGTVLHWDGSVLREYPYTPISGSFSGAGDLFSAAFTGNILTGGSPEESIRRSMDQVSTWLKASREDSYPATGIPVERFFGK